MDKAYLSQFIKRYHKKKSPLQKLGLTRDCPKITNISKFTEQLSDDIQPLTPEQLFKLALILIQEGPETDQLASRILIEIGSNFGCLEALIKLNQLHLLTIESVSFLAKNPPEFIIWLIQEINTQAKQTSVRELQQKLHYCFAINNETIMLSILNDLSTFSLVELQGLQRLTQAIPSLPIFTNHQCLHLLGIWRSVSKKIKPDNLMAVVDYCVSVKNKAHTLYLLANATQVTLPELKELHECCELIQDPKEYASAMSIFFNFNKQLLQKYQSILNHPEHIKHVHSAAFKCYIEAFLLLIPLELYNYELWWSDSDHSSDTSDEESSEEDIFNISYFAELLIQIHSNYILSFKNTLELLLCRNPELLNRKTSLILLKLQNTMYLNAVLKNTPFLSQECLDELIVRQKMELLKNDDEQDETDYFTQIITFREEEGQTSMRIISEPHIIAPKPKQRIIPLSWLGDLKTHELQAIESDNTSPLTGEESSEEPVFDDKITNDTIFASPSL